MSSYVRNRLCPCQRCRIRSLMGAGILISVGFLLLLGNYGILSFDASPAILIVIGLFLFISHNASMEGHAQRSEIPGPSTQAPTKPQQNNSQVTS
jgi:hypothetical protein